MKISEMPHCEIKVGLRIRSLTNPEKLGTVVKIDKEDDNYAWTQWDGDDKPYSGFYGNNCECEIVEDKQLSNLDNVIQYINDIEKTLRNPAVDYNMPKQEIFTESEMCTVRRNLASIRVLIEREKQPDLS